MIRFDKLAPKVGLAALLAATMIPIAAHAGEQTKAEAAIAEAKGKIEAGDRIGAGEQVPELQKQARDALASAEGQLAHHQKVDAIATARHANELADRAIESTNARKATAEREHRDSLRDSASAAQQSAATANLRADTAQAAATDANLRADTAERSSAVASAEANALRNTPPPAPQPATTTVAFTQHETAPARPATPVHHHVAHHTVHPAPDKTTTEVITTTNH